MAMDWKLWPWHAMKHSFLPRSSSEPRLLSPVQCVSHNSVVMLDQTHTVIDIVIIKGYSLQTFLLLIIQLSVSVLLIFIFCTLFVLFWWCHLANEIVFIAVNLDQ